MLTQHIPPPPPVRRFACDSLFLYQQLKSHDPSAIRFLHHKILSHLQIKRLQYTATSEDAEELADDAVMLALQKIGNGTYSYQGHSPTTFALLIADNLLRNFQRKNRRRHCPIDGIEIPQAPEALAYLTQKETEQKVEKMLARLSPPGRTVIRLKYFDGLRDEEVVARQLTRYSTATSLKSKRCAYLRMLKELARTAVCN